MEPPPFVPVYPSAQAIHFKNNIGNIAQKSNMALVKAMSKTPQNSSEVPKKKNAKLKQPKMSFTGCNKLSVRTAAGQIWKDDSLLDWDPNDFRIFVGDLGTEVSDEHLSRAFSKYPSFIKARVIRCRRSGRSRGYGFVSFKDPNDYSKAMREMNGKYVGCKPIKLRKSTWKDRDIECVRKKAKEKRKLGLI